MAASRCALTLFYEAMNSVAFITEFVDMTKTAGRLMHYRFESLYIPACALNLQESQWKHSIGAL